MSKPKQVIFEFGKPPPADVYIYRRVGLSERIVAENVHTGQLMTQALPFGSGQEDSFVVRLLMLALGPAWPLAVVYGWNQNIKLPSKAVYAVRRLGPMRVFSGPIVLAKKNVDGKYTKRFDLIKPKNPHYVHERNGLDWLPEGVQLSYHPMELTQAVPGALAAKVHRSYRSHLEQMFMLYERASKVDGPLFMRSSDEEQTPAPLSRVAGLEEMVKK